MRKDSEWPNPSVHFINSLKAAKKRKKDAKCSQHLLCARQCAWYMVVATAQFVDVKPETRKFIDLVKFMPTESR